MGRRPELKSDEFFESTPISSRDNLTFVFETAETSDSVIGNLTPCTLYRSISPRNNGTTGSPFR